jgi:hypothetical protein
MGFHARSTRENSVMKARNDMARRRGDLYLEYAKRYLAQGQVNQALATANEGMHLAGGQFYLAVQEQCGGSEEAHTRE